MHQESYERATVTHISIRKKETDCKPISPVEKPNQFQKVWRISDRLTRNFLCAALVIICVYAVQAAQFPDKTTVTTAIQSIIDENWDENLGRIQFVSNLFPETLSVFWNSTGKPALHLPQGSYILHAWSQDEPYLSLTIKKGTVPALASGTVSSVRSEPSGNYVITLSHENHFETIYHELVSCQVAEGDIVQFSQPIGLSSQDDTMIFELQQEGLPLDPTRLLNQAGDVF